MNERPDPLLRLLRNKYGHRWHIRRTEHLWVATVRVSETDHAPTLVEPDVEEFVRQLEDPPARAGRSLLARRWFQEQLYDLGHDGPYYCAGPPMT
ncbi:hypothetical protein F4561_005428 [Lipingzhangella halophila]|uniref:Uncharacterized protein n=1 Tax=Lipingzhangella halophila TaxID=1783352 RepID=A0A7W7RM99_9ACTN|nr:hypothetical protein [Lipingzhangella halophila]MBB4934608.1 hypothetical protein [Lipingzhangella halophila]